MGVTKMLIIVCIFLIVILYLQSYLKPISEYTILQYNLDKVTPDALYDKVPIIIYDILKDPRDLLTTLFEYSYIFKTYSKVYNGKIHQCKSKFSIVYTDSDDGCFMNIISPKFNVDLGKRISKQHKSVQFVTLKMKKHQVIILPMFWYVQSDRNINIIVLDDFISKMYRTIK